MYYCRLPCISGTMGRVHIWPLLLSCALSQRTLLGPWAVRRLWAANYQRVWVSAVFPYYADCPHFPWNGKGTNLNNIKQRVLQRQILAAPWWTTILSPRALGRITAQCCAALIIIAFIRHSAEGCALTLKDRSLRVCFAKSNLPVVVGQESKATLLLLSNILLCPLSSQFCTSLHVSDIFLKFL